MHTDPPGPPAPQGLSKAWHWPQGPQRDFLLSLHTASASGLSLGPQRALAQCLHLGCLPVPRMDGGKGGKGLWSLGITGRTGPAQFQMGQTHTWHRAPRLPAQTENPGIFLSAENKLLHVPPGYPAALCRTQFSVSGIARPGLRHSSESFLDVKHLFCCPAECSRASISQTAPQNPIPRTSQGQGFRYQIM